METNTVPHGPPRMGPRGSKSTSVLQRSIRQVLRVFLSACRLGLAGILYLVAYAGIALRRCWSLISRPHLRRRLTRYARYIGLIAAYTAAAINRWATRQLRAVHRLLLTRPHLALQARHAWYRAYHAWPFKRIIHGGILGIYILSISGVLIVNIARVFAGDTNTSWDFSNTNHYVLDGGLEFNGNEVRMAAQNYANDANTSGLFHLDASSGFTALDSSAHANDGTLTGGTFSLGNLNNGLDLNGTSDRVSVPDTAALSFNQAHSLEAWAKLDNTVSAGSLPQRQGIIDKGDYQLYYDNETGKLTYEIANSNYGSVTQVAGNDLGGSWDINGKTAVHATTVIDDTLYAGTGSATGDAEVYGWDGTTWTMIGGDGLNDSWPDQTYEYVYSLENDGTNIYAGLGSGNGDAEVWRFSSGSWTKIGGDALNGSWAVNTFQLVASLDYFGGNLYVGLGSDNNEGDVWRWNGSTWTQIGGDSLNGGWTTNFNIVAELDNDGTSLYAAIGSDVTEAEVWRFTSGSWTKIGGDGINSSWNTNYESVRSMLVSGSTVYAGLGDSADDAEVWRFSSGSWTQIGGDSISSSWGAGYEGVYDLELIGSDLYAGLASSDGDGEVYRYSGGSWTKIGGDGLNGSWATAAGDVVYALTNYDGTLYAGTSDANSSGYIYSWNGSTWTLRGGQYVNKSWGYNGIGSVETLHAARGNLYAGTGSAAGTAQVWEYNGSAWTMIGGQGINGSWAATTYELITSMSSYNGTVVVGLGSTANDAEVWQWNGSTWTQIGGDSLNSGWTTNYENVSSLAAYGNFLYAGLGASASDAEVWRWNGSVWAKIGGDNILSGWNTGYEHVASMTIYNGLLHAGLGDTAGDAEVWRWSGSAWTKIGGDGINSGWDNTIERVESMVAYNGKLYAGLGNSGGDADLWEWNGTAWSKVGGDEVNDSWASGTYEVVRSMTVYNGDLYIGLGNSAGDGEVWQYSGNSWTKVAGNNVNGGWAGSMEEVESMSNYRGKIYFGTGNSANADAAVWSWGNNGYLQTSASSFDTNWHHLAATYDGTTMKLFVDGVQDGSQTITLTLPNSSRPVLLGATYGGREQGKAQGFFDGKLDEVRLSNIARSSFTTVPYPTTPQVLSLATSALTVGVDDYDDFQASETTNGGIITYRLSNDDGDTWQYWNGSTWTASDDTSEANNAATVHDHIDDFSPSFYGIKWQAILSGNGNQRPSIQSVSISSNSDVTAPSANASSIQAYKSNGGDSIASNGWTNGSSPYFDWTAATDAGSGIKGYCLYLGTDNTANPVSTKGMLGPSPEYAGNLCQFLVTSTHVDLSTPGYILTALATSTSPYYLRIKAIDNAGNISANAEQLQFRFDNTPPTNPGYITAPSGFINTKETTLTWPTNGGSAASDAASGLAGLQYRINNTAWYGDSHTGNGDMGDLLTNDGNYVTQNSPDFANINEGINTIYFRTWDQAGNVTSSYTTAILKVNTAGAPSEPQNLSASPTTSATNSFTFDWDAPHTYVGEASNITYCYTINALPNAGNCTYTTAGVTALGSGPYATQPGVNTLYVVARDESNNINYSSYATVEFTANTPAPGIPANMDIVDVSIKSTSKWRLAITWEEPDDDGSGITSYRVYRSTNNSTFHFVGSSSSTTYIDANLSQQTYYYRVRACDNTNNCGANSTTVSDLPTGKFTSPATLTSQPQVSNITTKKATITWTTDRGSDSKVAIGTTSGQYGSSEVGNSDQVTLHTIELDNLAAGTTYYYEAKWTDEDGNTGTSAEFTFTTAPAPVVKEIETLSVGLSTATVQFKSQGATKVNLYYGQSDAFGGLKSVNTSTEESQYTFNLDGLSDGTKYFYRLSAFDAEGSEYAGNIFSFSTPPRPRINNLRFQPVPGEPTSTQLVSWQTNVPSTSMVVFGKVSGSSREVQSSDLKTDHQLKINNLEDDSLYTLIAQGRDKDGNLATSDRQQFRTALDTRPPTVTEISIESSIRGTGAEARGQVVISWKTDEPSMSQVAYTEGSNATVFNSRTAEDTELTTDHLVIVSDLPTSKVYSLQPVSKDKAGNAGTGEVQSAIIGRASESVLTIILNTLQRVFGL